MFTELAATLFAVASVTMVQAVPVLQRATTYSGDGTFYAPGLGACGLTNTSTQMIAAIGHTAFDTFPGATVNPNLNPICGKSVKATYGTKSVTVQIVDRCAGCAGEYDLDFSESAFALLADPAVGRIHGVTWEYI
ncbi:hypothetical protein GYMLUDRAFT_36947 [Collybiopsis luxurians FD-317 M1]|nr:hypothetical protein GYMLUDRAFT_36947 [Collybiopsis luxurians FD-317 M1]